MRVVVIGLGATGDAVVRYARESGDDVTVLDDRVARCTQADHHHPHQPMTPGMLM